MVKKHGIHFVHASDEWYILAGYELPEEGRYDGYLQLENGVGMMRLLETEVKERLEQLEGDDREVNATVATGRLAAPYIGKMIKLVQNKFPNVQAEVYAVKNNFFGEKMSSNYDFLNRDLLITCAMLHDVGKVKELSEFPKNDYTDEGNFLGHIVIGYEMVMEKVKQIDGFPDMLAMQIGHCILSHHGELEYGSPKKPSIAEAVALSMADNMDAKLETLREALEAKDTNDWLGYNRWLDSNIRRTTNEF